MTPARVVTTIYVFASFARVYMVIRTSEATLTPCIVVTTLAGVMGAVLMGWRGLHGLGCFSWEVERSSWETTKLLTNLL